ncbi:hypothetical protein NP493_591g00012 [Ridgeia piscesae]|uniref:Uncharacterized protein n=1 Tax=Ridgeia piscesae TaxID=27915 RepID=A0AAD9KUH5_RIDPI|nr:hypothetical protein NP493_591g00012 [Ridgeia piscesae]
MATVSNFGVSLCLVFVLFTVVEGQNEDERAGYLDAWWFICQPMTAPVKPPPYEPRDDDNPLGAPPAYQDAVQMQPAQPSEPAQTHRQQQNQQSDCLRVYQPMTAPVKPPPYQPRDDDNPLGAPPAYQDAVQMQPAQPSEPAQTHRQQQNQQSNCLRV